MKTERELMLANEMYLANDPELVRMRAYAAEFMQQYNTSLPADDYLRRELLDKYFGAVGKHVEIRPPFYCDYGSFIYLGSNVYMNFNCILLDCNEIRIGDNCMFGPNVQLYTAYHPMEATPRNSGRELAAPITIGNNVWLGGGVIVCPNVTIGNNTVIGAGAVVTKPIPDNVFAAGNPCKVIREIE
jgi:maltose O-acetyltransferase